MKWLKRPQSRGGHGCQVAVDECSTGKTGEIPDALGFCFYGQAVRDGTVMVECKTSRADFFADKAKQHRHTGGVGNWRYYMAPAGLIQVDELPDKWGLIEVNARGHLKLVRGPYQDSNYYSQVERLVSMRHEADVAREMYLVVRLFDRVGDPEKLAMQVKDRNRLAARVNDLSVELQHLKKSLDNLRFRNTQQAELLDRYRVTYGALGAEEPLHRSACAA
ncbi:adenylosuccinate synthase [Comamonas sp. w2-DMI]